MQLSPRLGKGKAGVVDDSFHKTSSLDVRDKQNGRASQLSHSSLLKNTEITLSMSLLFLFPIMTQRNVTESSNADHRTV